MAETVDPSKIVWDESPAPQAAPTQAQTPGSSGSTGAHEPDHALIEWDKEAPSNHSTAVDINGAKYTPNDLKGLPADDRKKLIGGIDATAYRQLPIEHRIALTGFDPERVMGSRLYRPEDWAVAPPMDWMNHPAAGFAAGLRRAAESIGQKAAHAKADITGTPLAESDKDYTDALSNFHEMNYNQRSGRNPGEEGTDPYRFAGTMLAASAIPGGPVVQGAAAGLLNKPQETTENTTPNQFWQTEAQQGVMGGALGKAGEEVGKAVAPAIEKGAGWLAGKMGVPSEVQAKLIDQARSMQFDNMDAIKEAAAGSGPRAAKAGELLRQIEGLGETKEMGRLLQTSMGIKALSEKIHSDSLFAQRDALAKGVNVDVSHTIKTIDDIIADAAEGSPNASKWPDSDKNNLIPKLKELRESLANTSKTTSNPTGLVDQFNKDIVNTTTKETPNTFQGMSKTRSDLGDEVSKFYKGNNAEMGEKGAANLQRVKEALANDLSDSAQKSGNPALAAADTAAKTHYSKMAGTLKDPDIVKALTSEKPDEILGAFIKANSGGTDRAKLLYGALDPKGRASVVAALFDNAMEKMDSANKMGGVDAFVDTMKQQRKILPVFLDKSSEKSVNGIINLMKASQGTGMATIVGGSLAAGAAYGGVPGAAGGALLGGLEEKFGLAGRPVSILAKSLLTSPTGKRYLERLATMDPAASSTAAFVQSMSRRLPVIMGHSAYNEMKYADDVIKRQGNPNLAGITPTKQTAQPWQPPVPAGATGEALPGK